MQEEDVQINVDYDEEFLEPIREGKTHFLGTMSVKIGDKYIAGGPKAPVADHIATALSQMLEAVEAVEQGNKYRFGTGDEPTYLVFEPVNGGLEITHCKTKSCVRDTSSRLDIEHKEVTTIEKYSEEIIKETESFVSKVGEINEMLTNSNALKSLENQLNELKTD